MSEYRTRRRFSCNGVKKIAFELLSKNDVSAMGKYFDQHLKDGIICKKEEGLIELRRSLKNYNRVSLMELASKYKKGLLKESMSKEAMLEVMYKFFAVEPDKKKEKQPSIRERLEGHKDEELIDLGKKYEVALGDKTRKEMIDILEKHFTDLQAKK